MDSGELKAAAAEFSSLPIHKKHSWVTTAIYIRDSYCSQHVQSSRIGKKRLKWCTYLDMKELMMIGDLDPVEAKKSEKVPYHSESFQVRLERYRIGQLDKGHPLEDPDKFGPSYNEEIFVDQKIKEFDYHDEDETRWTLDAEKRKNIAEKRKNMLAEVEIYRKRIEWAMKNRKKTGFNQSDDDGACPGTSKAKERKKMLVTYQMKMMESQRKKKDAGNISDEDDGKDNTCIEL